MKVRELVSIRRNRLHELAFEFVATIVVAGHRLEEVDELVLGVDRIVVVVAHQSLAVAGVRMIAAAAVRTIAVEAAVEDHTIVVV